MPVIVKKGEQQGFSLIEVLIAMIVIMIGLLGIAKLSALLIANTTVPKIRSTVALEAASLADSIKADPIFWQDYYGLGYSSSFSVAINPSASSPVSSSLGVLETAISLAQSNPSLCVSSSPPSTCEITTPSSTALMAGYQLVNWEQSLATALPMATATVSCSTNSQNQSMQVSTCVIVIDWTEETVNAESEENGSTAFLNQTYQLVVTP